MKRKLLIILLFVAQFIYGQRNVLSGHVFDPRTNKYISNTIVSIKNIDNDKVCYRTTNSLGYFAFDSIMFGDYIIVIKDTSIADSVTNSIKLEEAESIDLLLFSNKKCQEEKTIGICPYCNKSQTVIFIRPDMTAHYTFQNNRSARKYFRKREKQGYDTDWDQIWPDITTNKEFLIWVKSETEKNKLSDP